MNGVADAPATRPARSSIAADLARLGLWLPLGLSALLIIFHTVVSDPRLVRREELAHLRFEYPALARALYLGERAVSGSLFGIAIVNLVAMIAVAIVVAWVLREAGADVALWVSAPILVLAGQNWDVLTALTIALALREWFRGRDLLSGMWIGLGTAFKVVPVVLLAPIFGCAPRRRSWRVAAAAAVAWIATNAPQFVRDAEVWRYPYRYAARRTDVHGTLWSALPLRSTSLNVAAVALLAILLGIICWAVRAGRLNFAPACALAILAFIVTSKVWQPHYAIWLLPAAAFAGADRRFVRALEWGSLAWFLTLWRPSPEIHAGLFEWTVGAARLLCLIACAVAIAAAGRVRTA